MGKKKTKPNKFDECDGLTDDELKALLKEPPAELNLKGLDKNPVWEKLKPKVYLEVIKSQHKVSKAVEQFDKSSGRLAWIMIVVAVLQLVLIFKGY